MVRCVGDTHHQSKNYELRITKADFMKIGDLVPKFLKRTKDEGSKSAVAASPYPLPTEIAKWLGPRFEPSNISSAATAATLAEAIRSAENGETRDLFRFYRDALLGDDHIQGELNKRKLALLAQTMAILPETKGNADDELAVIACRRAVADCENWVNGLAAISSSCLWPVTVTERIFRAADASRKGEPGLQFTLRRLEPVNPQLFCFRWAYMTGGIAMGSATPVQQVGAAKLNPIDPFTIDLTRWEPYLKLWPIDNDGRIIYDASRAEYLDRTRHIVHRGHLLTEFRDNWGGPFRAIAGWYLLRQLGRDWFGRFMERYGAPFPVGKTNVEDPQAIAFLQGAFSLATKLGGLVIGQDDQVELVQAMVQGGAQGHEIWHNVCNNAISRAIVGQELSASSKATGLGSGVAELQGQVRQDVRMFDQASLGETVKKQVFDPFLLVNGLAGSVKVVWGGQSAEDAGNTASMLKDLAVANLEPADSALEVLSERVGFELQRKAVAPAAPSEQEELTQERLQEEQRRLALEQTGLSEEAQRLKRFSAELPAFIHPSDLVAARKKEALAKAYRGVMAPVRTIILSSTSEQEAEHRLATYFSDWDPVRVRAVLEEALQICAAEGASAAAAVKK
jgi:phage gp29-like protein